MLRGDVLLDALSREVIAAGVDPSAWVLGWARLVPSLLLVPAFGLRALPLFAQLSFALILAATVAPTLQPVAATDQPWLLALLAQLGSGLPVAVSAALTSWVASMAGNLLDQLRGASATPGTLLVIDEPATPLGILFSLAAAVAFLKLGGPARLTEALSVAQPLDAQTVRGVVTAVSRGIALAVSIAAPLLALVPFFELLEALISRAAHPASLTAVLAPLKSIALLAIVVLVLDRLIEGLVLWMDASLPG